MAPEAHNTPAPKPEGLRRGYASLAQFIASDKALCVFRHFDNLAMRNLLYMQDELCEVEEQLGELDKADMTSKIYVDLYSLRSRRFDQNTKRVVLMQRAAERLRCYEKALLRHSSLLALGKPADSDIKSLSNWMNGKNPTAKEESHFLDLRTDLSPLSQRDQQTFVETFLEKHCYKLFITEKHRSKPHAVSDQAYVCYYSRTTIRCFVRILATLTAASVITGPTFALYFERRLVVRLALVVVFSLVFAVMLALMIVCKNQEMFAIVAARTAVLIVFVGNALDGRAEST